MTEELIELELAFWKAAGDGAFYDEHMADNGLCVLPVGVMDKEATISAISRADPWETYEFSNVQTIQIGHDEVALTYRADAKRDEPYTALVSTVYTRQDGNWRLTLHQQTPIEIR